MTSHHHTLCWHKTQKGNPPRPPISAPCMGPLKKIFKILGDKYLACSPINNPHCSAILKKGVEKKTLACVKRARGTFGEGKFTLQISIQFKWKKKRYVISFSLFKRDRIFYFFSGDNVRLSGNNGSFPVFRPDISPAVPPFPWNPGSKNQHNKQIKIVTLPTPPRHCPGGKFFFLKKNSSGRTGKGPAVLWCVTGGSLIFCCLLKYPDLAGSGPVLWFLICLKYPKPTVCVVLF